MSPIIAIAFIVGVAAAHLRVRRHAGWLASPTGRFYISMSYPLAAIAMFWVTSGSTWDWAVASVWASAAVTSLSRGIAALRRVADAHAVLAQRLETIEPATGSIAI